MHAPGTDVHQHARQPCTGRLAKLLLTLLHAMHGASCCTMLCGVAYCTQEMQEQMLQVS